MGGNVSNQQQELLKSQHEDLTKTDFEEIYNLFMFLKGKLLVPQLNINPHIYFVTGPKQQKPLMFLSYTLSLIYMRT